METHTQSELDTLIDKYSARVVGNAYIDIIVLREDVEEFILKLTKHGFAVKAVSWWCYCKENNTTGCPHGYGGPRFEDGYFSEMSHVFDEYENDLKSVAEVNAHFIELIKNKVIGAPSNPEHLSYKKNTCLTPGIWIDVPADWKRTEKP